MLTEPAGHKKTAAETGAANGAKPKKERINGGNDLPVISQDGVSLSPTLHQIVLIELKHVAKVLLLCVFTKYFD